MGYDIYIGNTVMEPVEQYDDEEEYVTPYARTIKGQVCYFKPRVNRIEQPDAPTFPNDNLTKNGNDRHCSYSAWDEFCCKAGLHDLFFNKKHGLMREHPGHQPLKDCHAEEIGRALARWKEAHPNTIPGFEQWALYGDAPVVGYDYTLARLIWLDWWVKWAMSHCEHPGIYNF